MWKQIRNWVEYYILGHAKIKQFGENDYRVCEYVCGPGDTYLDQQNPVRNEYFWMTRECADKYAILASYAEAQEALLRYKEGKNRPKYPKKGKFV